MMNDKSENARKMPGFEGTPRPFKWTRSRDRAAQLLAQGYTQTEVAETVKVHDRTIRRWLEHPDFMTEVDRLTFMVDISLRSERLRIAMRAVRQKIKDGIVLTDKDALDWLKYVQGETDGVKLDLAALAETLL